MKSILNTQYSILVKDLLLCLISTILLILSFPRFDIWLLAWFGFIPLFFVLRNKSKVKAFLFGYLTGIVFWVGIIYWLVHVTLPGTIILILYLALYFGIFGLVFTSIQYPESRIGLLFIPSAWVLLEYIRGYLFTGFPWALLGYSQYNNLPIIQIADITGAWGVSFLVMMANVAIYSILDTRYSILEKKKEILVTISILLMVLVYGYYRLNRESRIQHLGSIKISVIQGNIPQELKWAPGSRSFIIGRYHLLTKQAAKHNPDLIIWPEASSPEVLGEDEQTFQTISSLSRDIKIPLLLGTVRYDNEKYFNSAILLDAQGKIAKHYDKLHLVPFGEYIPLKKFLPFLETVVPIGDITRGEEYTIFKLAGEPVSQLASLNRQTGKPADRQTGFAVLICFEDLFPELSRRFTKSGAGFLVNITNDAWYKQTSAPYQHLQASVFRAIENRIFLVRCANTGISSFIDPSGRIISLIKDSSGKDIFVDGYKMQKIAVWKRSLSFYTRYGDVFILANCVFLVSFIYLVCLDRMRKTRVASQTRKTAI